MACFKKKRDHEYEDKWTQRPLAITYWKIDADELERNLFVSPEDGFHVRIGVTPILKFYLTTMNLLN
jgi:hypothetical protein